MELIKHLTELLSSSDWMYLTMEIGVDLKDKLPCRLQLASGVGAGVVAR